MITIGLSSPLPQRNRDEGAPSRQDLVNILVPPSVTAGTLGCGVGLADFMGRSHSNSSSPLSCLDSRASPVE